MSGGILGSILNFSEHQTDQLNGSAVPVSLESVSHCVQGILQRTKQTVVPSPWEADILTARGRVEGGGRERQLIYTLIY